MVKRILASALAVLTLLQAGPAWSAPRLWAVRDADSTIYLFGTMHVLSPDSEWRSPGIDTALAEATEVWFEMDMATRPEDIAPVMFSLAFDFETPLPDKVDRKTMKALRKALRDDKLFLVMVDRMQPWFAAMLVMGKSITAGGQTAQAGADMTLSRDSVTAGKTLRYFETAEQQMQFLAGLPQETQIAFLKDCLAGFEAGREITGAMESVWGDGESFEAFSEAYIKVMRESSPEFYEVLVRRRNLAWADLLDAEMAGSGVDMVNVGALHLYGDDGLIALMRARGYAVEAVQ